VNVDHLLLDYLHVTFSLCTKFTRLIQIIRRIFHLCFQTQLPWHCQSHCIVINAFVISNLLVVIDTKNLVINISHHDTWELRSSKHSWYKRMASATTFYWKHRKMEYKLASLSTNINSNLHQICRESSGLYKG
jgi:hypothetical protein